jgi:hypothetical protein
MKEFSTIKVTVTFPRLNTVKIEVLVLQPENINTATPDQYRAFIFIWDGTKQELDGDFDIDDFNNDFY